MTNEELITLAKSGDSEAYNQLFRQNEKMVHKLAQLWRNTHLEHEELMSLCWIGLTKAYHSFDPDKGWKYITLASRCAENEIRMKIRKKQIETISVEAETKEDGTEYSWDMPCIEEGYEKVELLSTLQNIIQTVRLSRKEEIVLRELILGNRHQVEVAEMIQTRQGYVSRMVRRIQKRLKDAYECVS